jgi:hypothetical protein
VRHIVDEQHPQLLKQLAESTDVQYWRPALIPYLVTLPLDEATRLLACRAGQLTAADLARIARAIPEAWLLESRSLRELLGYDPRAKEYERQLLLSRSAMEQDTLAGQLADVLDQYGGRGWLSFGLSEDALAISPKLRHRAPLQFHTSFLVAMLRRYPSGEHCPRLRKELLKRLRQGRGWDHVPDDILGYPDILSKAPPERRVRYHAGRLKSVSPEDVDSLVQLLADDLACLPREEARRIIETLPSPHRGHDQLLRFLPPVRQVNEVWRTSQDAWRQKWYYLSWQARLLTLYRLASEQRLRAVSLPEQADEHPFVAATLLLLRTAENTAEAIFLRSNDYIQDAVVAEAWESVEPLDLFPLVPPCQPQVHDIKYCEGRTWPTKEEKKRRIRHTQRAYCPRARSACWTNDGNPNTSRYLGYGWQLVGARLYSDESLRWEDWSLQELLGHLGITPVVPDLKKPQEYVSLLSGWVNRLNEIRARLRCRACGVIMKANMKYAKHLAVYRSTVFSCEHGVGHDLNVYLSHCWACREIIDGRDCPVYVEGYRLCLGCGSGPQESQIYWQGSICPKCETQNMTPLDQYGRRFQCMVCHHTIKRPPADKLTGPLLAGEFVSTVFPTDEGYYPTNLSVIV